MAEGVGNAPTSAMPILFSGQVQPAYICLPSVKCSGWVGLALGRQGAGSLCSSSAAYYTSHFTLEIGCQTWTRTKTSGLTGRRATLTPSGNGAAGRTSTCIVPLRRWMPDVFDHGSMGNWSARQDLHLRSPGPKPGALAATLRAVAPRSLAKTGAVESRGMDSLESAPR